MDLRQFHWSSWTPSARRSWNSTRARVLSRKMIGVPVSFLRPSLLGLGRVGLSSGYLLVVSRVGPRCLLRITRLISQGKPEDSSKQTGAAGSSPQGEAPVKRRVRAQPRYQLLLLAPEDDPDLRSSRHRSFSSEVACEALPHEFSSVSTKDQHAWIARRDLRQVRPHSQGLSCL